MSAEQSTAPREPGQPTPAYATIPNWCAISGMSRSATYLALGRGDLLAKKLGKRVLIDVPHGLAWISSLRPAVIRAPKAAA